MTTERFADPGWIATDIEPTDITADRTADLTAPQGSGVRRAAVAARSQASAGVARLRAETPRRARQVSRTARGNPLPVAAAALAAVGAVVALVIHRRAAARAAANQGPLAFLRRFR
jgi:hypothetical protein